MATKTPLLEEIKTAQVKSATASKVYDELHAKLAEIEGEQSAAHVTAAKIPALKIRKQAYQADKAMGKPIKQADIDQVDAEIASAIAEVEYHEQTAVGLKNKLADALIAKTNLSDNVIVLKRAYIEGEAESLHAEYMNLAEGLLSMFRRIQALSRLSKGIGGNPFSYGDEHKVIAIPVFHFASSGQWPENYSGHGCRWLPAVDMARPEIYAQADEESERAKLVALGIQI